MHFKKSIVSAALAISLALVPYATFADSKGHRGHVNERQSDQKQHSPFNEFHYDYTTYKEIGNQLKAIEKKSNRVTLKTPAQSANGNNLYVVTVSEPSAKGKYGKYQALRQKMFQFPGKAQEFVDKHPEFKIPVLINASIHGNEFVGSDAALRLIKRFAFQNDETTKQILKNHILIFNVVQNPDGRIQATRFNGNGFDINRDFITQSQPETKLTVDLITKWNPMMVFDLHGYVSGGETADKQGLIEPCTPPHNPNYEYDLLKKWMVDQAKAMEQNILSHKKAFEDSTYENMKGVVIPLRDWEAGWDDYPPIFTPMYAMYHGAYAYTLEAPTNQEDAVKWHVKAVMGALKYSTEHKNAMIKDQIEIFKRGINYHHPYHEDGFFPHAYVLPVDPAAKKAVRHLLDNGIQVVKAKRSFVVSGKTYPKGSYIVEMDQAKAGLANTMLWDGEDITDETPAMYDISAWSLPELWGFKAIPVKKDIHVQTAPVNHVNKKGELVGQGPYVIENSSVAAVKLVNSLLEKGIDVQRGLEGDFYFETVNSDVRHLINESGLRIKTKEIPDNAVTLTELKVGILKDGGINKGQSHADELAALQKMGFDVEPITPRQVVEKGIIQYDVFIYSGQYEMVEYKFEREANQPFGLASKEQFEQFKKAVTTFVENGKSFIAIGAESSQAAKTLGLTDVRVQQGGSNSNGIVKVNYTDSQLTSGYKTSDIGFVYEPAWYTNLSGEKVLASYEEQNFFVAGHWKNRDAAQGKPVIIKENGGNVILMGLEPTFRAHTKYLYRLVSNAIFSAISGK